MKVSAELLANACKESHSAEARLAEQIKWAERDKKELQAGLDKAIELSKASEANAANAAATADGLKVRHQSGPAHTYTVDSLACQSEPSLSKSAQLEHTGSAGALQPHCGGCLI